MVDLAQFLYKFFIYWLTFKTCYHVTIDRNKLDMNEIYQILNNLKNEKDISTFLSELLTDSEIETLSKRWRILKLLAKGETQRQISKDLNVSLCKVTRGSRILKNKNAITTKFLIKEKNSE